LSRQPTKGLTGKHGLLLQEKTDIIKNSCPSFLIIKNWLMTSGLKSGIIITSLQNTKRIQYGSQNITDAAER
jgi:hypothetical protein